MATPRLGLGIAIAAAVGAGALYLVSRAKADEGDESNGNGGGLPPCQKASDCPATLPACFEGKCRPLLAGSLATPEFTTPTWSYTEPLGDFWFVSTVVGVAALRAKCESAIGDMRFTVQLLRRGEVVRERSWEQGDLNCVETFDVAVVFNDIADAIRFKGRKKLPFEADLPAFKRFAGVIQ